jgi:hypothetical protein
MIAEEVKALTKERVLRMMDRHMSKGAPHRQKLSVQVFGSSHVGAMITPIAGDEILIKDVVEFKRTSKLFSLPKSLNVSEMTMEAVLAKSNETTQKVV